MMENNYIKKLLKVINWPILFWIGQFLVLLIVEIIFCCFDNIDNFNDFINSNSYIISCLNLIIFLPIFLKEFHKYDKEHSIDLKKSFKIVLIAFLLSFILNLIILFVKLNLKIDMTFQFNIFAFINVAIIGPILEEYLFRGIVFNKLLEFNNKKKACLITTLIFSLIHLNIFSIIYTFIIGFILNKIYVKYQNINYSIIFHITINIVSSLLIPFIYIYLILP